MGTRLLKRYVSRNLGAAPMTWSEEAEAPDKRRLDKLTEAARGSKRDGDEQPVPGASRGARGAREPGRARVKRALLMSCIVGLSACKSDVERCVDAQMEAFDDQYADAPPGDRDSARAFAHKECAGD